MIRTTPKHRWLTTILGAAMTVCLLPSPLLAGGENHGASYRPGKVGNRPKVLAGSENEQRAGHGVLNGAGLGRGVADEALGKKTFSMPGLRHRVLNWKNETKPRGGAELALPSWKALPERTLKALKGGNERLAAKDKTPNRGTRDKDTVSSTRSQGSSTNSRSSVSQARHGSDDRPPLLKKRGKRDDDHAVIQRDYGPIVDKSSVPLLHGLLEQAFQRLARALENRSESQLMFIDELLIVDSEQPKCVVNTEESRNVRGKRNNLIVSSGFIKSLFKMVPGTGKEQVDAVLHVLTGAMAQELARSWIAADNTRQVNMDTQERDLFVDTEAVSLLREAGLPRDAVYQYLRLQRPPRNLQGWSSNKAAVEMITAGVSRNASPHVRIAAMRMFLTADRYKNGEPLATRMTVTAAQESQLRQEIEHLVGGMLQWGFERPRSIGETLDRLNLLPGLDTERHSADYLKLEFNRLVLALDEHLLQAQREQRKLTVDERAGIIRFFRRLDEFPAFCRAEWIAEVSARHGVAAPRMPSHQLIIDRIDFYASPEFVDGTWQDLSAKERRQDPLTQLSNQLRYADMKYPSDVVVERLGGDYLDALRESLKETGSRLSMTRHEIFEKAGDPSYQLSVRLDYLLAKHIWPHLSREQKIDFSRNMYVYSLFPLADHGFSQFTSGNTPDRFAVNATRRGTYGQHLRDVLGHRVEQDLAPKLKAIMQLVWDEREIFATANLISGYKLNWSAIARVLGIDPSHVSRELVSSIQRFTRTPEYAEMLKQRGSRFSEPPYRSLPDLPLTLYGDLAGHQNKTIQADPELRQLAKEVAGTYLVASPSNTEKVYRRQLGRALAAVKDVHESQVTAEWFMDRNLEINEALGADLCHGSHSSFEKSGASLAVIRAQEISRATLRPAVKRKLLRMLFVTDHGTNNIEIGTLYPALRYDWLRGRGMRPEHCREIMSLLLKHDVLRSPSEYFNVPSYLGAPGQLESIDSDRRAAWLSFLNTYAKTLLKFQPDLLGELEAIQRSSMTDDAKRAAVLKLAEVVDPRQGNYNRESRLLFSNRHWKLKRALLAAATAYELTQDEKLTLFRRLTSTGGFSEADEFYRRHIEKEAGPDEIESDLWRQRIHGSSYRLELAKQILEPTVQALVHDQSETRTSKLFELVHLINEYLPSGSLAKDDYLESLGWRFGLEGMTLKGLIADQKANNWRTPHAVVLQLASGAAATLELTSAKQRNDLINFFRDPERSNFQLPASFKESLTKSIRPGNTPQGATELTEEIVLGLEALAVNSSPQERIPLFEVLIREGRDSLSRSKDYPQNIIREHLGWQPKGDEERGLETFLHVIPEWERAATLAYLLSLGDKDRSMANSVLEVFRTVGKKIGQANADWKFLGDENSRDAIARENQKLKDNAKPMEREAILDLVNRTLSLEERQQIASFDEVLGAASVKTVVRVTLRDGSKAALLVQQPEIRDQIRSDLRVGKAFLQEAEKRELVTVSALFRAMLPGLEAQLGEEVDMRNDATNAADASALFRDHLNRQLSKELGGWRFEVPRVLDGFRPRENLLVMELAQGETFDKLPADLQRQVGPVVVRAKLRMMFRWGKFNADPHTGNFMFDRKTKTIYSIDYGQYGRLGRSNPFREDNRLLLARFIQGVGQKKPELLAKTALKMSHDPAAIVNETALVAELQQVLQRDYDVVSDQIVDVVTTFAEHGIVLRKEFAFDGLKGLITLYGNAYLTEAAKAQGQAPGDLFKRELEHEVKRLILTKAPTIALDRFHAATP